MKKSVFLLIVVLLTLTGCKETKEKKAKYEELIESSRIMMVEYLQKYYNIDEVRDVHNASSGEINYNPFPSYSFNGKPTGTFTINGEDYEIICSYDEKKCYDTYTFELKVKPLLIDVIKEYIGNVEVKRLYFTGRSAGPEELAYYVKGGIHSADDILTSKEDAIQYINPKGIMVFDYYSNDKILDNMVNGINKIAKLFGLYVEVGEFTFNGDLIEIYRGDPDDSNGLYYNYDYKEIGNYKLRWLFSEKNLDSEKPCEFKIDLVDNEENYFENNIVLDNEDYYLYNNQILSVTNLKKSDGRYTINIYVINVDSMGKDIKLVYKKENGEYKDLYESKNSYSYTFYSPITEKFAIYCKK